MTAIAVVLATTVSMAQDTESIVISLDEVIDRTVANNHQLKVAAFEVEASKADILGSKAFFLPQLEASLTGSVSNLPLNAFGSKLNQGVIKQEDFIPSSLNDPSASTNLQSQFVIRQPILNLDGRSAKRAVESATEAWSYQAVRTEKHLRHQAAQAYLQLQLTYEVVEVLEQARLTAEASLKLTKDNVKEGYAQKADVLYAELRLAEIDNQLAEAGNNILNASDQLSFLMGSDLGTAYKPEAALTEVAEAAYIADELPMERSDIRAMEMQMDAKRHMLESSQKAKVPRINAFGSYEVNNPLDFADAQHGFVVAVQASWSIFNGNANRSAVQKARIDLDKFETGMDQYIAQNKLELEAAKRKLADSRSRIDLAELSIEQSREILRIKTDRYEEGLEKTIDVLMAETEVAQKEMNYVEALYQYQVANAGLMLMLEKE